MIDRAALVEEMLDASVPNYITDASVRSIALQGARNIALSETEQEELIQQTMSAALAVAEAAFERREAHEPIGCPTPGACSCVVSQDDARADLVRWLEEQLRIKIHTVVFDDLVNGQQGGRPLAFLIEQAQLTQDAAIRARGEREDGR